MSLIEQAAKRLAELQLAGASVPAAARPAIAEGRPRTVSAPRAAEPPLVVERPRVVVDVARLKDLGFVTPDAWGTLAQEMRVLKRPILRAAADHGARRVMVTSALTGEGKTFTAINLALSIASEIDTTVTLVDGDVVHPTVHDILGVPARRGLLDLLARDDVEIDDVLLDTNVEGLTLLPPGTASPRATEFLASDKMASLAAALTSKFPGRIIVFDSPPLLVTTEARVLATHMDQVLVVVAADSTSRDTVLQALATVERCETVYTALNKAVASESSAYDGHYSGRPLG